MKKALLILLAAMSAQALAAEKKEFPAKYTTRFA